MEFISTKNMKNEDAPEGTVLVKYLEPSWGGWYCQYGMAYFDNPNDYENSCDGEGWKHDNTGNTLNVVAYCKLPEIDQETENPFNDLDQKAVNAKYGTYTPNLGCVGQ
ncbi:MAG: hypothetical protein GY679_00240 [Mycoplasma sp.]|nr:hypothetical protein [Mycoplasma sp.]